MRIAVAALVVATLSVTGGALAAPPSAWRVAAYNVLNARPAAEVYAYKHRDSYAGMTTAKLAAIGSGFGGPIRARVAWATKSDYCLTSTVRGVTAHGMSAAHHNGALRGPCPPQG